MNNELLKLLNLSRDNNDRFVIYNPENPEKSWVAVSLEDYQKLVNDDKNNKRGELTDANSDDKIDSIKGNNSYTEKESSDNDINEEDLNRMSGDREVYSDPNMPTSVKDLLEDKKEKWQIAKQVKSSAAEVIE